MLYNYGMKKIILKKRKKEYHCNNCGKKLKSNKGMIMEGAARISIDWGYFSERDGQKHSFTLCEACYDKITATFKIPYSVFEKMSWDDNDC